ncbi:MAG TPA: hypothetical protein VKA48_09960 [Gammaproteobacteria bacterium]|nr:hypothetical protein [Gammaproteobacteria bacterium]
METFSHTHNLLEGGVQRVEWPDGRPMMEQEAILLQGFAVIRDELAKMRQRQDQGHAGR